MRIETLEYVMKIAQTKSISQAAEQINIQQTTLSAAVRSLENELGFSIFVRNHNGVALTEQGQQAMEIIQRMIDAYTELKALPQKEPPTLRLYVNSSIYNMFSNSIYRQLYNSNADLALKLYRIEPESYWARYRESDGHQIGIDYYFKNQTQTMQIYCLQNGLIAEPLMENRLMAYINRSNPLSRKESVTWDMLAGQRVILGRHVERQMQNIGRELQGYFVIEGPDETQALDLINTTDAIAIFPDYKVIPERELPDRYTEVVPIDIQNDREDNISFVQCLIYQKGIRFSKSERALLDIIRHFFRA